MQIIDEKNLRFTFPDDWKVVKYDETDFYRKKVESMGAELAAMDIVGFRLKTNDLKMIEIKDFRGYAVQNRKRQTSGELQKEVLQKFTHTLSALYLASYSKKELFEYAECPLIPLGNNELLPSRKIELILFMEDDIPDNKIQLDNQSKNIANMTLQFRSKLKKLNVGVKILNISILSARDGFSVNTI